MPTPTSIVDVLKSKNLPSDAGFRSNLYAGLGLGSTDQYLAGIQTGKTNEELLGRFNANPALLDAIAASYHSSGSLSEIDTSTLAKTNAATMKVTGNTATGDATIPPGWDAVTYANFKKANGGLEPNAADTARMQGAAGGTGPDGKIPDSVDSINSFQQSLVGRFQTAQQKADTERAAIENTQPKTLEQIINDENTIRSSLGITSLEDAYNSLSQTIAGVANDVRKEAQATGGVMTESQITQQAYERTKELSPQLERLQNTLTNKYAMADIIRKNLQTSQDEANQKADKLLELYQGDADKALAAISTYYKEDQDTLRQTIKDNQDARSKILELSLKYPRAGINAASDDLTSAYAAASKYAAVHGDPGEQADLKKKAEYAAARTFLSDNQDASYSELRGGILENTNLSSNEVDTLLDAEGHRKDELGKLTPDQLSSVAISIVKSVGDVAEAKSWLDGNSTLPINGKEVFISKALKDQIKAAMDEAYPSGERSLFQRYLPYGK